MKKTQKYSRPFRLFDNSSDTMPVYDPEDNLYNDPFFSNSLTFNSKSQINVNDFDFAKNREFQRFDEI